MAFVETFSGIPLLAFYGTRVRLDRQIDDTITIVDETGMSALPALVFGAPVPTIVSVTGTRVSKVDGCARVFVEFVFNQPVTAWVVRVGATNAFDGTLADHWDGAPVGSGTAEVVAASLHHGANIVSVWGRDSDGGWTVPVVPIESAS